MTRQLTLAHLTLSQPPLVMIEAAEAGGFASVGIRICPRRPGDGYFVDLRGAPEKTRDVRRAAADRGIRLSNVSAYQFYPEVDLAQLLPAVEATAELGCDILVVNCFDPDRGRFRDRLFGYAEAASVHGIRLALEFMPYSQVRTLADARTVLTAVGMANVGLLVDSLHLDRSGGAPADLAVLDPGEIVFAQICDARPKAEGASDDALMHEARHSRLPLGSGTLPLGAFVAALPASVEVEYEVAGLPGATPAEIAKAARADLDAFMGRTGHA